jgi:crotonobetainyl-CoA:carnitine CoA-transferase CaiB-like acyl-CoA transferase
VIDGKRKHGGGRGRAAHPKRGPRSTSARPPLVIDLSSLWAGPLCASLLGAAGARVVKVESRTRPDGARRGTPAFFDLLNAGKQSVALDLDGRAGVGALRALIDAADVVVESARPRVTAQWGIDVPSLLAGRDRPLVWVSLTGYGRNGPWANRVAYGDDAAAAAGLVARDADGEPRFCGDAMADPIAGVHAAAAALAGLVGGGNHLIDVSLREAAGSTLLRPDGMDLAAPRRGRPPAPPVARSPLGRGRALGADTASVLAEVGHQFR